MSKDLEPFVQVELEILLDGTANESAPPAAASSMGDGASDGATRAEEEDVDVRVYLGDDGEADVEVEVQRLQRDVGAERAVFPLVAKGVGGECAVAVFLHEDDRVEDSGYSS